MLILIIAPELDAPLFMFSWIILNKEFLQCKRMSTLSDRSNAGHWFNNIDIAKMDHNFVTNTEINSTVYTYVLLDVLLCSIAEYFTSCAVEPVGRAKILSDTTKQNV